MRVEQKNLCALIDNKARWNVPRDTRPLVSSPLVQAVGNAISEKARVPLSKHDDTTYRIWDRLMLSSHFSIR